MMKSGRQSTNVRDHREVPQDLKEMWLRKLQAANNTIATRGISPPQAYSGNFEQDLAKLAAFYDAIWKQ